jgi:hypothetical protein
MGEELRMYLTEIRCDDERKRDFTFSNIGF